MQLSPTYIDTFKLEHAERVRRSEERRRGSEAKVRQPHAGAESERVIRFPFLRLISSRPSVA